MTIEECEEFYEETALGYFYGYGADDERFTMQVTWVVGPIFRNENGGVCEDPGVAWFPR